MAAEFAPLPSRPDQGAQTGFADPLGKTDAFPCQVQATRNGQSIGPVRVGLTDTAGALQVLVDAVDTSFPTSSVCVLERRRQQLEDGELEIGDVCAENCAVKGCGHCVMVEVQEVPQN